ncbi:UNVERIFIED_CONTAM: hypothetical protein PYX00_005142 [Menopon gallinae]|uniref:Mpv17-like protein n=1 Tax=Menopon gallinae TaxID=328185 RepID=A0AAW2HPV1_9NEOP
MIVKLWSYTTRYPVLKGMVSYAMIWPLGSCIQQKIAGSEKIDFGRAFRFALYGSCFVAPTLYIWVKASSRLWPNPNFKTAVKKALIEQVSYGPAAMVCFFFGMTLLEGGSIEDAKNEVKAKFLSTYKVGVCVWPVLQTINFAFVPERNRVVFVSVCSLMWTSFLAYMKQLQRERELEKSNILQK